MTLEHAAIAAYIVMIAVTTGTIALGLATYRGRYRSALRRKSQARRHVA
jgi:hypothetical protein